LVDIDHLVQVLQALDAVVCSRFQGSRAVQGGGAQWEQRVVDQRRFARAGNTGHAGQQAQRNLQVDIAQVISARALEVQRHFFVTRRALGWHFDFHATGQVLAGQRVRVSHHFGRRALGDNMPAMHTRTRTNVDHIIGQANRVFVVLNHDHRVADIAQVFQRTQQAIIVTLVQADRRLVEDVQNAHQAGTNLAGQANPLGLTTGQGIRAAIQRQVVQADVDQELQALANFLENLVGNFPTAAGQLEYTEVFTGIADRQVGYCRQRLLAYPYVPRLTTQRVPRQSGHGWVLRNFASSSRTLADSVSR